MRHHDRIQHAREGTDYKAPLRAINEEIEGLVHCSMVIRAYEEGAVIPSDIRALDAIGTQVVRELKQRAEMIRSLVARCMLLEARVQNAKETCGYIIPPDLLEVPRELSREELIRQSMMPEQQSRTLHLAEPA